MTGKNDVEQVVLERWDLVAVVAAARRFRLRAAVVAETAQSGAFEHVLLLDDDGTASESAWQLRLDAVLPWLQALLRE